MQNLAGNKDCDAAIETELTRCGIEIVRGERSAHEVAASITGKLGAFTFRRAWYYWIVEGRMPFETAMSLYNNPVGRRDIRTAGFAGNIDPHEFGTDYFDEAGDMLEWAEVKGGAGYASAFVRGYHVDSELGLYILAEAIRGLSAIAAERECLACGQPRSEHTMSRSCEGFRRRNSP